MRAEKPSAIIGHASKHCQFSPVIHWVVAGAKKQKAGNRRLFIWFG
jgi:hypothetical protein